MTKSSQRIARAGARLTRAQPMVPEFLIVGGKRCGSTSLYEYIIRHRSVLPSRAKKGTHYFDVNYPRGLRWYRSMFPTQPRRAGSRPAPALTGEASPYYMFHPLAPGRIAATLPGVRLIAVLRDPVERAWSHYRYNVGRGFEHLPVEAALDREPERLAGEVERMLDPGYRSYAHRHHTYLARGHYAEHLEALGAFVPPGRILVLQSEALFADPAATLGGVFRYLGLPDASLGPLPVYKAARDEAMPIGVRRRLEEYYGPHNDRLSAHPGVGFRWEPRG